MIGTANNVEKRGDATRVKARFYNTIGDEVKEEGHA